MDKKLIIILISLIILSCDSERKKLIKNSDYLKKADSLYIKENYGAALDILDSISIYDSANPEVYKQKALCYSKLKLKPDALYNINNAISLEKK
jgi:hypothetical protein